jgi:hypothetical protein
MYSSEEADGMSALPRLRWSTLKHVGRSLAHYRYYLDNPIVETDAMRVGSRVHDLVLNGGRNRFAVWEGKKRAGKEWDLFALAHADATIVTSDQEERAGAIASAVLGNSEAHAALFGLVTEKQREWSIAGRDCQGTPDAVGPDSIVNLKVTNDGSPGRFPWHAKKMGWLGQLAWYDYGLFAGNATQLVIVSVEDKPPHLVTVYKLTADAAELGHRTWRSHFERLRVAEESNVFPGYSDCVVPLEVDQEFSLHMGGEEIEL